MIEIVVLIAHAIHVQLLLFLSHHQVEELGGILVVVQMNLAVHEAQEARGMKRNIRIIKEGKSWW